MKILIVNTYDKGGAANACLRLHEGLLQEGIDSKVLLMRKQKSLPNTFQFNGKLQKTSKLKILKKKALVFLRVLGVVNKKDSKEKSFLKQRSSNLELFSFAHSKFDITTSPLYQEADIINLHWVANFLDYESFFRKNTKPVVWTLHDMNPFTGGEHYLESFLEMDSKGYPIARELSKEDMRYQDTILSLKIKAISRASHINIVAPSKWLVKEAQKSLVFKNMNVHHIPYGINTEIFQRRDKEYSRGILNLPKNKKIVLFVADSISNNRKGYAYLKKAIESIQDENVILCAIGRKKSNLKSEKNMVELGSINDERLMSIVYSAADVFVIPSLMDNLPNTVLESIMCGTPVIGFSVGGIRDMVQNKKNGLVVEEISSDALQEKIKEFLSSSHQYDGNSIRMEAMKKYELSIQARTYMKLYQQILKRES